MDNTIYNKKIIKKAIVYTSAAMLFTAAPSLPVSAAEIASQTESSTSPAEAADSSTSNINVSPADPTTVTPETPTDMITVTPLPEPAPADQNTVDITPMQGTVYASSQKGLNVRSGPSTNHSRLGTLKYGQEITVTGKTADNWYQIQYSGNVGYVNADFVSDTPPANTQTPAVQEPAAESPAPEAPDTEQAPPAGESAVDTGSETQTEDDSSGGENTVIVSNLIGTPVYIVLAVAIVGVLALIGYSVYSLFKRDDDASDEYYGDEYYEDDEDEEYYEDDEEYSDEEYYEDDEEYYENDGQYSDEEYYENNGQYPDEAFYENDEQYPDEAFYENNEPDSDETYYEDNGRHR